MLDNVRKVASKAATAWGIEAAAAEDRESRQDQPPIAADEAASLADRFEDEDDPMFSEKLDPMDQRSPNNSR